MRIISRHLLAELLGATLLGSLLLAALIFLLQALRLGHHLAGSGAGLSLLGQALLLSTPSLLTFSLPLAAAAAVLLVWGRLADTGQLLALEAAGASPMQLVRPVLVLLVVVGLAAIGLGRWVEPAALQRLQARLVREASFALLGGLRPGQFQKLAPELTLHAETPRHGRVPGEVQVEGLFLARTRPVQQLLARQALLRAGPDATLALELREGELRAVGGGGRLERVCFGKASLVMSLADGLRPHLSFLERRALEAPGRGLAAAASGLCLGLLALLLGTLLRLPWLRGLLALTALALEQGGLLLLAALGADAAAGLCFSASVAVLALVALVRWG